MDMIFQLIVENNRELFEDSIEILDSIRLQISKDKISWFFL